LSVISFSQVSSDHTIEEDLATLNARFELELSELGFLDHYTGDSRMEDAESLALYLGAMSNSSFIGRDFQKLEYACNRIIADFQDGDVAFGFGLSFAWDAFGDNSVNPSQTEYAISNALVIMGLLEVLESKSFSIHCRNSVKKIIYRTIMHQVNHAFHDEGNDQGFFWYSYQLDDAKYVPNVNAMSVAVFYDAISRFPEIFKTETQVINEVLDKSFNKLVKTFRSTKHGPFWNYYATNFRNSNDLVHHSYIIYSIQKLRHSGKAIPYSSDEAISSLNTFWRNNFLMDFSSQDSGYLTDSLTKTRASLWGLGAALMAYNVLGDDLAILRILKIIHREYGNWPELTRLPVHISKAPRFYARQVSHVLYGLSEYVEGNKRLKT
jgi:hypothetical protein